MFENFPYTNFHDLNLDFIIQKVLEAYGPDNPPPVGLVLSVNGMTGEVVLFREQNVRLPDVEDSSWNFYRLSNENATGIKFTNGGPAERIDGANRYQIYDTGNPPPSVTPPVDSVDGMTGTVKTWANSQYQTLETPTTAPANIWDLRRELNNGDKVGIEFEYDSVNQVYKAYLKYTPSGGSPTRVELLSTANIPASGVVSVNSKTGIVNIYATDIALSDQSQQSIADALSTITGDITTLSSTVASKYTMPLNGIPASDLAPGVIPDISGKLDKPTVTGTTGQILTLNSSQQPVWENKHKTLATVTADGIKTYAQLLNSLKPYLDTVADVDIPYVVMKDHVGNFLNCINKNSSGYVFAVTFSGPLENPPVLYWTARADITNDSKYTYSRNIGGTASAVDVSSIVATEGETLALYV